MDSLRVRVYNVRFGDAILISVPDAAEGQSRVRHILIDVGNALNKEGGKDFVFKPILEDIRAQLDGSPIDLFIMTHEHMDHIQGLFYGEEKEELERLPVDNAWLTASAAPDYYDREWPEEDEDGDPLKQPGQALAEMKAIYEESNHFANARKSAGEALPPFVEALLLNNNPRSSDDCVQYLRQLATEQKTHYVYRGLDDLDERHSFQVAKIDLWAPEENTAVYYGHFRPVTLGLESGNGGEPAQLIRPQPPSGVDAGAFYGLVEARRGAFLDNLLAIDKAKNNSSVVFCLQWQGWKLLFPGDAEIRSWKEMDKRDLLEPVHFLKISHHASHNGTPHDELLDKLLPEPAPDERDRVAVASTYPDTYSGIPDRLTLQRLEDRGVRTFMVYEELGDIPPEEGELPKPVIGYLDFTFPADGQNIGVQTGTLVLPEDD